jgi:2-oxoglutarate ferredoxin oxidoreductase subunit alpha
MDRGKILWEEDLERMLAQAGGWGRYLDVDNDGIAYRTLPGNRHTRSAYFCRGTGHDEYARYSEEPDVWERVLDRIAKKFVTAKQILPKPVVTTRPGAKIGIIGYGSTDPAIIEALDLLEDKGVAADYLRLRALPLDDEVKRFIDTHDIVYVVELNRDGQLTQLMHVELPNLCANVISLAHVDGMPMTAKWIVDHICVAEVK